MSPEPAGGEVRPGVQRGRWLRSATGLLGSVLLLGLLAVPLLPSCNDDSGLLRAKVIEYRSERVGGPVSMADIGDFLLENDQIRVAILRASDSPGPGPYGGSIVDIDLRRPMIGLEGGHGRDRFAEAFPMANLLVPEPDTAEVYVLKDGSDGQEAAIRVEADGGFFLQALGVLRTQKALLDLFYPNVRTELHFTTDYILRPGDRHVIIRTMLRFSNEVPAGCPLTSSCPVQCENGFTSLPDGCLSCECSAVVELDNYDGPLEVFRNLLGDPDPEGDPEAVYRAGIIAGDFMFFGNQNNVFSPGPGFDESWELHHAFDLGRNTFTEPLSYDYVAAAGGDISYGYFTVARPGEPDTRVNVPLITSAATAFLSSFKNCLVDSADDGACDRNRAFVYERYLAVGDGDVASVTAEMYRVRGTPTGLLRGHLFWDETGEPVPNGQVIVFLDPDPSRRWSSVDELVEANLAARGDFGVFSAMDADLGLDLVEDGDFSGPLPAGRYVLVGQTKDGSAVSRPASIEVRAGRHTVAAPRLPTPATVAYRVSDESGTTSPAKIVFVRLDENGQPYQGDGLRRPYLGHSRLGNGKQTQVLTPTGHGEVQVQPGRYDIIATRGPEFSLYRRADVELRSGRLERFDALIHREIDSTGWMSIDTHLHSTMSFDSGLPVDVRVIAAVAEGLEFAVATDHDVRTDYLPYVRALSLEPFLATAVGEETTTLEQGHFIGFPLAYDELEIPTHGALDWTCMTVEELFAELRNTSDDIEPLTVVAHPRDGFLGFMSQLGVDTYTMNRELSLFEQSNPTFRTATCEFDAMEMFNAKRFELLRTPSVLEVVAYNRCLADVNAATNVDDLIAAWNGPFRCSEFTVGHAPPPTDCARFDECQSRFRSAIAWLGLKRILTRTPAEQDHNWAFGGTAEDSKALCDLAALGEAQVPPENVDQPCTYRPGQVDEFFRLIERGMTPTQLGASDSHGHDKEPGYPRSYFRSPTDSALAVSVGDAVDSLRAGTAFATYGPFLRASVDGKTFGEITGAQPGQEVALDLEVQTASWFGVDRVEVYLNGRLERLITPQPEGGTSAIVDLRGKVTFQMPDRDSWVVILALGLEDENLMRPVSLDLPWGELELSAIASDAFSRVPMIDTIFPSPPAIPSWGPVPSLAISNPIYLDADGNGRFDAPLPPPDFCSRPCDPANADPNQCPTGQTCLQDERKCGFAISGRCRRYPRVRMTHP